MEQEQRLIDKKTLADKYKKWIDDCASENMKTECGVIEDCLCELYAQEVVDPIHAAGGCRCGECIFATPFPSDVKTMLCGNGKSCRKNTTDFCSYGEPRTPPAESR